jgi:hypothetical protein
LFLHASYTATIKDVAASDDTQRPIKEEVVLLPSEFAVDDVHSPEEAIAVQLQHSSSRQSPPSQYTLGCAKYVHPDPQTCDKQVPNVRTQEEDDDSNRLLLLSPSSFVGAGVIATRKRSLI